MCPAHEGESWPVEATPLPLPSVVASAATPELSKDILLCAPGKYLLPVRRGLFISTIFVLWFEDMIIQESFFP